MAHIVHLGDFQRGWRCPKTGIVFPKLYYCRGYYYGNKMEKLVSPENRAPAFFSLESGAQGGLHSVTSRRIHALPPHETGRLIVRHHLTLEMAEGYFDALMDMVCGEADPHPRLDCFKYVTSSGVFTLVHVLTPEGREEGLLVYVVKTFREGSRSGITDWFTAIRRDGTTIQNFVDE